MLRLAIREVFRRRLRTFLLALTVIIAGSFMVATLILGDSLIAGLKAADVDEQAFFAGEEGIRYVRNILLSFNFLAFLVGVFVIANTFWVILSQRAYELALLRVIGASRGQVFGIVIWEALLVGIFGGLASILCGIGLAQGFFSLSDALDWEVAHAGLRFSPWVFVLPMVLAVYFTLKAAVLPAIIASRRSPLSSLTAAYGLVKNKHRLLALIGLILLALGGLLQAAILLAPPPGPETDGLAAGGVQLLRSAVFWIGQLFVFVSAAFLSIPIAKWLAGLLRRLLSRSRLLSWRLAANNIWRQPTRTAFTANVLMVGVVLVSVITVIASSVQLTVIELVERTRGSDWTLQAAHEAGEWEEAPPDWLPHLPDWDDTGPGTARITPADLQRLAEAEATDKVMGVRFARVHHRSPEAAAERDSVFHIHNSALMSVDGRVFADLYDRVEFSRGALANLERGQLLVSEEYLRLLDYGDGSPAIGDPIVLFHDQAFSSEPGSEAVPDEADPAAGGISPEEAGETTFVIGGTFGFLAFGSGHWWPDFLISHETFAGFVGGENYNIAEFDNAAGYGHEETRRSLEDFLESREGLVLDGKLDTIDFVNLVIRWLVNVFRALLGLAVIVAIVGILNTLVLAVSERAREIGLLRAIGASAGAMRRTLAAEAVFIASLGVALGIGLALLFAWGSIEVFVNQPLEASSESLAEVGEEEAARVLFSVPWLELSLYYLVAVCLAWLASIAPALKATRVKIVEALRSG